MPLRYVNYKYYSPYAIKDSQLARLLYTNLIVMSQVLPVHRMAVIEITLRLGPIAVKFGKCVIVSIAFGSVAYSGYGAVLLISRSQVRLLVDALSGGDPG